MNETSFVIASHTLNVGKFAWSRRFGNRIDAL